VFEDEVFGEGLFPQDNSDESDNAIVVGSVNTTMSSFRQIITAECEM
jgi:hypothetical protein